jgi:hypothetical protein
MKNAGDTSSVGAEGVSFRVAHSITKLSGKRTAFGQLSGKQVHRRSNLLIEEKLSGL